MYTFVCGHTMGFPDDSVVRNPPLDAGDMGLIPGLGGSPGEGNGNPLSILAWKIPWIEEPGGLPGGITKSQTQLID